MKDKFEKIFGKEPKEGYEFTYTSITCGYRAIVISWSAKGIGFGEFAIILDKDSNTIFADTEHMGKEFCDALVEKACEDFDKKIPIKEPYIKDGKFIEDERYGLLCSNFIKNIYACIDWSKSD